MHSVSRDIDAPAHIAWRLLIDTAEWPRWGPSVRAVEAPQRRIGPGMRGRIQTPPGLWLPFDITAWQPGEVVESYHRLAVSPDLPPGDYTLVAGLYNPADFTRLPATNESGQPIPNNAAPIGQVTLP